MSKSPVVLICPLDWGIGHATRCVPVVRSFQKHGCRVILAAGGRSMEFLKDELPECETIHFPGQKVTYAGTGFLGLKMFLLTPLLLLGILREHFQLKKIIRQHHLDVVFSDNRYGLWNKSTHCIFMTHQVRVIPPSFFNIFSGLVNSFLYSFIRKFDACWVPDLPHEPSLAGILSHPNKVSFPLKYIGLLSRFEDESPVNSETIQQPLDFMVILSGPEPQRTIFEKKVLQQLKGSALKGVIVRGMPGSSGSSKLTGKITVYDHLGTRKMMEVICSANLIICRPGYSTIMDLVALGKKAVFIPTPGQPEQEYLADNLLEKEYFYYMPQDDLDMNHAISFGGNFPGLVMRSESNLLDEQVSAVSGNR
jgi:uncharacterized protein (TIGR00661 family)